MLRVVHLSDVHIRTLQKHDEYRRVFDDLYRHLDELKPDLVINTGDTVHSKVNISPELVEIVAEHLRRVSEYAQYHIILGNHDLNLANKIRQDAISPIVENIKASAHGIYLHKRSGLCLTKKDKEEKFNFWNFSIVEPTVIPSVPYSDDAVNIGLFHGSVVGALTDINWSLRGSEHDISMFDGLDYVMMGDVHHQQSFKNGRIRYAGSLIQQDFGESRDKGFLLWNIFSKDSFEVKSIFLNGSRKFYSFKANDDLSVNGRDIESGSRIRVFPPRALTFAEQRELKRIVKQKFAAYDVVIPPSKEEFNKGKKSTLIGQEDLRDLRVQEALLREHIKDAPANIIEKIIEINDRIHSEIGRQDDVVRNVSWRLERSLWNCLFQYGSGNIIDFDKLGQLVGIFSPNASGKSNLIDAINFSLFNKTTTGVGRNVHLINDESEGAVSVVEFSVDDKSYVVERTLDRVKKKGRDESKGSCSFYRVDNSGRPLNECLKDSNESGIDRQDTDRQIQHCIGTFEDFALTSLSAQNNPLDLINCKESKRKEILYRFLDLNIFETKRELAKDEFKSWKVRLKDIDVEKLQLELKTSKEDLGSLRTFLQENSVRIQEVEEKIEACDKELLIFAESMPKNEKVVIDLDPNLLIQLRDRLSKLEAVQVVESKKVSGASVGFVDPKLIKILVDAVDALANDIRAKERAIVEFNTQKNQDLRQAALLQSVPCGDQFPMCRFLVEAIGAKDRLKTSDDAVPAALEMALTEVKLKHEEARRDRDLSQRASEAWKEFELLRTQVEGRNSVIESLREQERRFIEQIETLENVSAQRLKKKEIELKMKIIQDSKVELQRRLKELQKSSTDLNRKIGFEQGIIERAEKLIGEAQEVQQWCTAYEHYDEAMGKNGIPCTILARKLPSINEEIAKVLSAGVEFGVFIDHDPASQSIPLYLLPGEGERIRPLELASGAQKFLASLAMRVALLRVSSLPRCNTFVVDEGFGKLDPTNIEGVSKIFDILRSSFEHVLIISHLDALKDIVDDVIEISLDERGLAHVEVM